MRTEIRDSVNAEVGQARSIGTEIEGLLTGGTPITDPRVRELMGQREGHISAAEAHRQRGVDEDRSAMFDQWQDELTAAPVVAPGTAAGSGDPERNDHTGSAEYAQAFRRYMRRFVPGEGDRFGETERHLLSITSDPAGGYTVPTDVRAGILARIPAMSRVLRFVNSFPTSRDTVEWVRVQARATQGSIYTSAFVGSMVGETPAANDGQNEPAFGKFDILIKKARTKALISMDLASDSETDLMTFLRNDGALNMALLRESQVLTGDGIGKNVKGITSYNGGTTGGTDFADENTITAIDVSGTTADQISNTTAAISSASKLLDLVYGVPAQYRAMPDFGLVFNSNTAKKIRQLVDAQNRFIWSAGFEGTPDTFDGYPAIVSEFMASGGTDGNVVIIAGALSQLVNPVRMDVSAQVLVERYADNDEIGLFLRQRFGASVSNCDAFRLGIV